MSSRARFRRKIRSGYSKPKSAESVSSQITLVDLSEISVKCSTPYRLPRITPTCDSPFTSLESNLDHSEKQFGRHGYEDVAGTPELGPSISRAIVNPHSTLAKSYRQAGLAVPQFRNAAITPSYRHTPYIGGGQDDGLGEEYDTHLYRQSTDLGHAPFTSMSRAFSPAKSAKSIHWALGNDRNPLFDATGRSKAQGPFSREFTVRCQPPPNWMRMKWGRSRHMAPVVH